MKEKARYRLNAEGCRSFEHMSRTGSIVGESRDGRCWMVLPDGNKISFALAKSFVDVEESIHWNDIREAVK